MAESVGKVYAELGLTTTIGADLAKARAEMAGGLSSLGSGITGALSGAASALTTLGVAAGATAAVVGGISVNAFKNFEQAVSNAASVTGLTGAAFQAAKKNISDVAQTLGQETTYSSSEAADALYNLASAGVDVANITAGDLKPVLDMAAGSQYGLAESVALTTGVLNQFGLSFKDSARVADVLAASTGQTAATMDKLSLSFREVGSIAAVSGRSIEEVTAALGVMYNKNMTGEQAGTGLKIMLASLLNPSDAAAAALKKLGLTFDQVNPQTNSLATIISLLASHGLDASTAFSIFGREGAPAILALTSSAGDVEKFTQALQNAGGTAQTMATQQLDTLSGSVENMKGVLENVSINIGAALAPAIRGIAGEVADAGPGIQSALLGIVGFFTELGGKLGPSINNVKTIVRELSTVFSDVFKSMSGGQGNATDAIAGVLNGITGAVADAIPKIWTGINKVILIFGQLKDALGPTIDNVKTTVENLLPALSSIWDAIKPEVSIAIAAVVIALNLLSGAIATVTKFAAEHPTLLKFVVAIGTLLAGIAALPAIVAGVTAAYLGIAAAVSGGVGAITAGLSILAGPVGIAIALIALLAYAWANDWGGIREKAAAVWENIKMTLDKFFKGVETFCNGLIEAWGRLKTNLGTIWDMLKTACETFYTNLQTIWNNLIIAISNAATTIQTTLQNWHTTAQNIYNQAQTALQNLYTWMQTTWTNIQTAISNAANAIWQLLLKWYNDLLNVYNQVQAALEALRAWLAAKWEEIKTMIQTAANAVWQILLNWYNDLVNVYNQVQAALEALKQYMFEKWEEVKQIFTDAKDRIIEKLQQLVTDAKTEIENLKNGILEKIDGIKTAIEDKATEWYNAGKKLADSLADGLKDAYHSAVNAVTGGNEKIDKQMPHSPAKEGPFRRLPKWDVVMVDPIKAAISRISEARAGLKTQLSELQKLMTFSQQAPVFNLAGNLAGFTAALHKVLDTPKTESSSSKSSSSGGTWSKTSSTNGQTTTTSGNMTAAQAQALLAKMEKLIQAQAPQITIKDVKLDQAYNFNKLISDVEKYQTAQRRQRGAYL